MKTQIPLQEVTFSEMSSVDNVGKVFFWRGRVFRAINQTFVDNTERLFSSGLISDLVNQGLFPATTITQYEIGDYKLVIEHNKLDPVTYPSEWSFSMMKDAACTLLKVNIIANKYDCEVKDGHAYNIIFNGVKPLFVDFGSLVPCVDGTQGWSGYEEFLQYFIYPLKIWSVNSFIARRVLLSIGMGGMPHDSYIFYKYPICRHLGINNVTRFTKLYFKYRLLGSIPKEKLEKHLPYWMVKLILVIRRRNLLPFAHVNFDALINQIGRLKMSRQRTMWSGYHEEFVNEGRLDSTPRFDRIIDVIRGLKARSMLEFGGNQGVFSRLVYRREKIPRIICSDYDEDAVDCLYNTLKNNSDRCVPAVVNFLDPNVRAFEEPATERFRSDIVVALALTHHLILTQGLSLNSILSKLCKYSSRYIIVEFMPLGLWAGGKLPDVPNWYTTEWFRGAFLKYCDLVLEEKLEKNRILFVGEIVCANNQDIYKVGSD